MDLPEMEIKVLRREVLFMLFTAEGLKAVSLAQADSIRFPWRFLHSSKILAVVFRATDVGPALIIIFITECLPDTGEIIFTVLLLYIRISSRINTVFPPVPLNSTSPYHPFLHMGK